MNLRVFSFFLLTSETQIWCMCNIGKGSLSQLFFFLHLSLYMLLLLSGIVLAYLLENCMHARHFLHEFARKIYNNIYFGLIFILFISCLFVCLFVCLCEWASLWICWWHKQNKNNTSNKNKTLVHLQPITEFDREASSKEYNYLTNDPRQLGICYAISISDI